MLEAAGATDLIETAAVNVDATHVFGVYKQRFGLNAENYLLALEPVALVLANPNDVVRATIRILYLWPSAASERWLLFVCVAEHHPDRYSVLPVFESILGIYEPAAPSKSASTLSGRSSRPPYFEVVIPWLQPPPPVVPQQHSVH